MKKITASFRRALMLIGWVQLNLLLGLLYFLFLTPYALMLRLVFRVKFLPSGGWSKAETAPPSLAAMRRSF